MIVIARANLFTFAGKALLICFVAFLLLIRIMPSVALFHLLFISISILAGFMLVIVPFFNALEEALHMGICIQQGNSRFIRGLVIVFLATRGNRQIAVSAVATRFKGTFKFSEKTRIHAGAPLTILIFLCAALVLILLTTKLPLRKIIWFWTMGAIFPVGSLVPAKFIFESDGSCILRDMKRYNEPFYKAIKESIIGVYYGIRYIILGSLGVKTTNGTVKGRIAYESYKRGDLENAITVLEEELKGNENNPEICNNLAWCYAELGTNIERAILLAQRAVAVDSSEAIYHDTLGLCYYKGGDMDMAKKEAALAKEINPESGNLDDHIKEIDIV